MNGSAHDTPLPELPVTRLSLPLVQVIVSGALRLGAESAHADTRDRRAA